MIVIRYLGLPELCSMYVSGSLTPRYFTTEILQTAPCPVLPGYFGINYFGMTCIFGVWLISGHSVLASSIADGDYDTLDVLGLTTLHQEF